MSDKPLRAACIHGRYDAHTSWIPELPKDSPQRQMKSRCPGGRIITNEELVRMAAMWTDIAAAIGDTDEEVPE